MPPSPALAHHRARVASLTRYRAADDADLLAAQQALKAANCAAYVKRVLAQTPPLLDEQLSRLADLVREGGATTPPLLDEQLSRLADLLPEGGAR